MRFNPRPKLQEEEQSINVSDDWIAERMWSRSFSCFFFVNYATSDPATLQIPIPLEVVRFLTP